MLDIIARLLLSAGIMIGTAQLSTSSHTDAARPVDAASTGVPARIG